VKVLIVGCGRVGSQVARDMSVAGHEVTIVDRTPSAFATAAVRGVLDDAYTGNQVVGDGIDEEVLRRAGIEDADAFVAVTDGDNRNIMAAQIAQHVFNVRHVVCRIVDPIRTEEYRKMGMTVLCPTLTGAEFVKERLR
jgi:trk system potassium uptake protein TrkA